MIQASFFFFGKGPFFVDCFEEKFENYFWAKTAIKKISL